MSEDNNQNERKNNSYIDNPEELYNSSDINDFTINPDFYKKVSKHLYPKIKTFLYNVTKCLCLLIKVFIIFFIVINCILFPIFALSQINKKYPLQNSMLFCSHMITRLYILPLSSAFGYKNILTIPFYAIRAPLYNAGMHYLPNNAPEKMVWWYNTRFLEFVAIIKPQLGDWTSSRTMPFSKYEKQCIENRLKETYSHIKVFPNTDLSNTIYSGKELFIYRDMILAYCKGENYYSITQQQIASPGYYSRNQAPGPKYNAVEHNIELIKSFDDFKEKIRKENPKAFQKYEKTIVDEYIMKKSVTNALLRYQETFSKIDCNSFEFQLWHHVQLDMIDYIIKNQLSGPEDMKCQYALLSAVDMTVCPVEYEEYNKKHAELKKYYDISNEQYKKEKGIN